MLGGLDVKGIRDLRTAPGTEVQTIFLGELVPGTLIRADTYNNCYLLEMLDPKRLLVGMARCEPRPHTLAFGYRGERALAMPILQVGKIILYADGTHSSVVEKLAILDK